METEQATSTVAAIPLATRDVDRDLALAAARVWPATKRFGLSLGDRLCLALACREGMPVLTTDRAWKDVGPVLGIDIRLIR